MPVSHCFPCQRPECWKVLRAIDKTRHGINKPTSSTATSRHHLQEPRLCQPCCSLVRLQALFTRDLFVALYSNHTCKHIDMWHLPGDALAFSRRQWNLASALSSIHASLFFVRGDYSPALSPIGFSCPHRTWHPAPGSRLGAHSGVVSGSSPHLVTHACAVFLRLQNATCSPAQRVPVDSLILLPPKYEHLLSTKLSCSPSWQDHSPPILA